MADYYVKKQLHYEAIPNTPANRERIRELTHFDPDVYPAQFVIPWCIETQSADPYCYSFKEFRDRYELPEPEEPV